MKSKFRPIEFDYHAVLKMNRAICKQAGMDVKYFSEAESDKSVPYTDGKTIYIPAPLPTFTPEEWNRWLNTNFHEVGHNIPECVDSFAESKKRKLGSKGFYGFMNNLMEDYRVDLTRCSQYRGMAQSNDAAMQYWALKSAEALQGNDHKSKELDVIHTLMAFDIYNRQGWSPSLRGGDAQFTKDFTPEMKGWYKKLTDKYADKYHEMETAADVFDLQDELLKEVFDIDPEKEKEKNREQNKGNGKGKGSKGEEGNGNSEKSEGSGSQEGESGEDESENNEKPSSTRDTECSVDYEKLLNSHHDDDFKADATKLAPMHIEYESFKNAADYSPHTDATNKIFDFHTGKNVGNQFVSSHRSTTVQDINRLIASLHVPALAQEARRLLQVMTRKRNFYNQKKGRLDVNKIYRVCQPHSSVSERIFKTKTESNALDTAVSVLVDYSGSMGGYKIQTAISAGYALEMLCGMLKINCEIAGFTEYGQQSNNFYVFKNFGHTIQDSQFIENMSLASSHMSSNADGDSILIAWHRLMQQKQKRKVLIVLSDGSPASGRGDSYTYTKQIVKGIEARGDSDIIGIGIMDNNVTGIYKHNHVIHDINQLPTALIKTLEHVILSND